MIFSIFHLILKKKKIQKNLSINNNNSISNNFKTWKFNNRDNNNKINKIIMYNSYPLKKSFKIQVLIITKN